MIIDFYQIKDKMVLSFVILIFLALQSFTFAQTGSMTGKVYDKDSDQSLIGTNIILSGTSMGAASDLDGKYVIRNIPVGKYKVVVSYIGYNSDTVAVDITANRMLEQNFYLRAKALEGKTVVITGQAKGQVSAIQQQLTSNKIENVVSEARIQQLPDFNAAQALSRLPGISTLQSSGEADKVVIRGLAPQYNAIAVDGFKLSSTGSTSYGGTQDRSVDLSMITPYMIKTISVYKTLTPDLNANAIGGYVNMQLREAPSGIHSDLLWQSGYTAKSKTYSNYRTVLSGSDRFFNDQLGVYALVNAESYDRNSDNMNAGYQITQHIIGPNGYEPVQVTSVTLNRHIETRKRYGGNLILDYRLPNGSVKLVNMFSRLASDFKDYDNQLDYRNHQLNFSLRQGNRKTDLALNSIDITNDFGFMSVDLKAANKYSRNDLPNSPLFQFNQTGGIGNAAINTAPEDLSQGVKYYGPSDSYLYNITLYNTDYKENSQSYKIDLKIPKNFGSEISGYFKVGGEFQYSNINNLQSAPNAGSGIHGGTAISDSMISGIIRTFNVAYDSSAGKFPAANFTSDNSSLTNSFLGDKFGNFYWAPNAGVLSNVVNFLANNPEYSATGPLYSSLQPGGWFNGLYESLPNNYHYVERYYAAYAMLDYNINKFTVVGGVRYEEDKKLFQAYNMFDARNPLLQPVDTVTVYPQNHYVLPMVQVKYDLFSWLDVRYSYTQTLARPAYTELSPHINMSFSRTFVSAGNPNLKPGHAYNHDLILTFHNNEIGLFSIAGFYKTVKDFTYHTQYKLHSTGKPGIIDSLDSFSITGVQPNDGATLSTYINSPYLAYIKGIEVDFQTRFWYLPDPFSGLVLGLNYTKISSKATYPWRDDVTHFYPPPKRGTYVTVKDSSRGGRLVDQPNDIFNAYIGYDYQGFSTRVSFLFQGNSVSYIGAFSEQDGFTKDYFRIDLSARQKLPWPGLEIFLDVNNLNNEQNISVQQSIQGFTNQQNYGITADIGVRYRL